MSSSASFRPATREDSRKIAELFGIASGGVARYVWSSLAPEYPGLTPVDPILEPYATLEVPGSYYVSAMAVFPEHRGQGLGTRMLEMARHQARRSGCRQVSLLVSGQNEGAVELYERNGFEVAGRARLSAAREDPLHGRGPAHDSSRVGRQEVDGEERRARGE